MTEQPAEHICNMLEIARGFLRRGWSVIPQEAGTKHPLIKWKQFQEHLPTSECIDEWWTRWRDAGISLVLGPVSGVVAVDVDSEAAHHAFHGLLGGDPQTLTTRSGSRLPWKAHHIYRCPQFCTTARYTPLHPQLEFRGHGGSIVLPPSVHPSGYRYEWVDPDVPIAPLPESLAALWRRNPRELRKSMAGDPPISLPSENAPAMSSCSVHNLFNDPRIARSTREWLRGEYAQKRGWNDNLFRAACDLAGFPMSLAEVEPLLLNGASPNTPEDEQRARATILSAYSKTRTPSRQFAASASTAMQSRQYFPHIFIFPPKKRRRRAR